jgi:glycosyltransferase involved in cell wall biosynthesis
MNPSQPLSQLRSSCRIFGSIYRENLLAPDTGFPQGPSNIVFTGFLSEEDFYSLMSRVDAVVSITTRYGAVVCGGHEAIALGKPFITGNNNALKRHFRSAGLYCDGTASSIQSTILDLQSHYRKQTLAVLAFREIYPGEWCVSFAALLRRIEALGA